MVTVSFMGQICLVLTASSQDLNWEPIELMLDYTTATFITTFSEVNVSNACLYSVVRVFLGCFRCQKSLRSSSFDSGLKVVLQV